MRFRNKDKYFGTNVKIKKYKTFLMSHTYVLSKNFLHADAKQTVGLSILSSILLMFAPIMLMCYIKTNNIRRLKRIMLKQFK